MDIKEKRAYIKGLCEGLRLTADTKEAKVLLAVVDLLNDIASEVSTNGEAIDQIFEELDDVDESLEEFDDYILSEEEEKEACCHHPHPHPEDCGFPHHPHPEECGCPHHHHHHPHPIEEEFLDDEDDPMYEVTCPSCGETVCMDEDTLLSGDAVCPNCGTPFEVEFEDEDEEGEKEDKD